MFLFPALAFAQDYSGLLPSVSWKTNVDSVVFVNTDTFTVKVSPLDLDEPGAFEKVVGNYLKDNKGRNYKIIDSSPLVDGFVITVVDVYKSGAAPYEGLKGYVNLSPSEKGLSVNTFEELDPKAEPYSRVIDNMILWEKISELSYDTALITQQFFRSGQFIAVPGDNVVTFSTPFPDANYSVFANATYDNPRLQPLIIRNKTAAGFTLKGVIDTALIDWSAQREVEKLGSLIDTLVKVTQNITGADSLGLSGDTISIYAGDSLLSSALLPVSDETDPIALDSINNNLRPDIQNLKTSKQDTITLTTTGNSGASTFDGTTLNVPNYVDGLTGGYVPYFTTQLINSPISTNGVSVVVGSSGNNVGEKLELSVDTRQITTDNDIFAARIHGYSNNGLLVHSGRSPYVGGASYDVLRISSNAIGFVEYPILIANDRGRVLIHTETDNTVDALQVNGTVSFSPAALGNQGLIKSQLEDASLDVDFNSIAINGYDIKQIISDSINHAADTFYTYSSVWAEEGVALSTSTNSGYQFSFGNGATSESGIVIGYDCEITGMTLSCGTTQTATVDLYKNGADTGEDISISAATTAATTFTTPVTISAGDRITFRTSSGGSGFPNVIAATIRQTNIINR